MWLEAPGRCSPLKGQLLSVLRLPVVLQAWLPLDQHPIPFALTHEVVHIVPPALLIAVPLLIDPYC